MTNPKHLSIAATGLLLGPLLFTVGDLFRRLVEPSGTPTATDITTSVAAHGALWLLAGLLSIGAAFLLVVGMVGVVATARGRGARLTTIGAVMVAVGAIASVGHAVAFYAPYALYDKAGVPAASIKALDDASESYPLLVVLIVLFLVGMMLGSIVLFLGLRRAGRVPIWSVIAAVVFVACGSTGGVFPGVLGILAALAAFGPAALSMLRQGSPGQAAEPSRVG